MWKTSGWIPVETHRLSEYSTDLSEYSTDGPIKYKADSWTHHVPDDLPLQILPTLNPTTKIQ